MEDKDLKMWSYRIVHDKQFAPNPFKGVLTLATCKPKIRCSRESKPGIWLAGFAAYSVVGDGIRPRKGSERLIYLAKISEVIPMKDYWKKYPQKRAVNCNDDQFEEYYGDNIYNEKLELVNQNHHREGDIRRDISGKNVLICEEYYYFVPKNRLEIPPEFDDLVYKRRGQVLMTNSDKIRQFVEFVKSETEGKSGIIGNISRQKYDATIDCSCQTIEVKSNGCSSSEESTSKNSCGK